MLNFGNKEFRNLQEQVLQNANELQEIKQSLGTALPNPIAGPQGPKGDTVIGPRGERGSIWTVGTDFPASPRESDLHLKNSEVYQYTNGKWVLYSSIKGSQGVQGVKGNTGDIGPIGPVGPRGEQGTAAPIYQIMGKVNDISQLPAPSTVAANSAYIVGNSIYGIVEREWTYLTTFLTVNTASNISFTPSGFVNVQDVQGALESVISKVTTIETDLADEIARAETADDNLDVAIQSKLDKDGYSALAHVGLADNIASPDGILDDAVFVMQSTGGTADITDGFADIKEFRGNTIISNQPVKNSRFTTSEEWRITTTDATSTWGTNKLTIKTTRSGSDWTAVYQYINGLHLNDKYYLKIKHTKSSNCNLRLRYPYLMYITENSEYIITANEVSEGSLFFQVQSTDGQEATLELTEVVLVNLTQMFGPGKEPTTVAEFNNLTRDVDLTNYDEGTPISYKPTRIDTVGFNAFDGGIEGGNYHNDGGYKISSTNNFRSSDYISVVCGKEYTIFTDIDYTNGQVNIYEYDKNKNFIGMQYSYNKPYATFALKDNTCYIAFSYYKPSSGWGSNPPTNAKICLHLTHSGYRNGQYEPHWHSFRVFNSLGMFNELRSAGNAYDSWVPGKYTKNINVIDLGTPNWQYAGANIFYASLTNVKPTDDYTKANISCPKYTIVRRADLANGTICISGTDVIIQDASYTDASLFKAAMAGIPFYYENLVSEVTEYDTDKEWSIRVSDFGTTEGIQSPNDAPYRAEIFYMANLRDKIRRLPDIPKCEETVGTYVLKCINGTYTWVRED